MVKILLIFALVICSITVNAYEDYDWWECGNFYQIYPRSYKDSDGTGIGDLKGITSKLEHLKDINVTAAWLSPIFKSPMKDFGYDISDFRAIDERFGTMEDFERLTARAKELNIKIVLDFVPNHSSDEHEWFKKSSNPDDPEHEKYKDYYIWNEGKLLENGTRLPPSNWLSIFRGTAWTWSESRKAFYLHQFLEEQPDLNYRSKAVVDEMREVLRFWLRKGVGGFRCDTVPMLYEVEENEDGLYDDEPLSGDCVDDPEAACYLKHTKTQDLNETYYEIFGWRDVLEEEEFSDFTRILMTEAYTSLPNNLRYYGEVNENGEVVRYGSQIPFNFDFLMGTNKYTKAGEYKDRIEEWVNGLPKGKGIHANWVLGNHDQKRLASRFGPERIDLLNILLKMLPGNAVTYNGEEIGATDVHISWEDTVDPQACRTNPEVYESVSRDPGRTPFQWDGTKNAGFSTADKTWLPVALNYSDCNVELQNSQEKSHLKVFRALISLRQNPTFKYGGLAVDAVDDELLVFKREIEEAGSDVIVAVLNFGDSKKTVDLTSRFSGLPAQLQVAISSIHSDLSNGDTVEASKVEISPQAGLVLMGRKN